jgi:hypothetical protein
MPCLPRIRRQNGAASAVLLIGLNDDQRFSPDRGSSKKNYHRLSDEYAEEPTVTNPRDRWLEARGGLTGLLETLRPSLDENTLKLVQEFVANREFGIALEWLYSVVLERKIGLSAQQSKDFKELAKLMEMDLPG